MYGFLTILTLWLLKYGLVYQSVILDSGRHFTPLQAPRSSLGFTQCIPTVLPRGQSRRGLNVMTFLIPELKTRVVA
jgi:hypothetical protein